MENEIYVKIKIWYEIFVSLFASFREYLSILLHINAIKKSQLFSIYS